MSRNDAALSRNTQPVPAAAITSPATAGPIKRAALSDALFSDTALTTWSWGTRSDTIAARAGPSNAEMSPRTPAATRSRAGVASPSSVTTASATAWMAKAPCVNMSRRRRSIRSASTPAQGPTSSIGRNCSAVTNPNMSASSVRARTSHDWPIRYIHVPTFDASIPLAYRR